MIAPPDFLISLTQPWADFYGHSKAASIIVTYGHIGGLLLAGGIAIGADRATLRVNSADPAARGRQVADVGTAHRVVIAGLVVMVLSGLALLAADLEAFWGSWVFWTKMTLVAILLANGYGMTRAEAAYASGDPAKADDAWSALRRAAMASMALWFTTALVGVALVNLA